MSPVLHNLHPGLRLRAPREREMQRAILGDMVVDGNQGDGDDDDVEVVQVNPNWGSPYLRRL